MNGLEATGTQDLPSLESEYFSVPQPVCHNREPVGPIAVVVPPTAVTNGLVAGKSACLRPIAATSSPLSPDENSTLMPSRAAWLKNWLYAATSAAETPSPRSPHELV